jgi:hypothetical protein
VKVKKDNKVEPIKKVPLITGLIFVGIGIFNLVLVFVSAESTKSTYAVMVASFVGLGVTLLDKSGVFER